MKDPSRDEWFRRISQWSSSLRAVGMFAIFGCMFGILAPLAWLWQGPQGIWALGAAIGTCLIAGWLALLVTTRFVGHDNVAVHVFVGMGVRMSIPLVVCLIVTQQFPELIKAGFAYYLIAAFLVNLIIETVFAVGQLQAISETARPSGVTNVRTPS